MKNKYSAILIILLHAYGVTFSLIILFLSVVTFLPLAINIPLQLKNSDVLFYGELLLPLIGILILIFYKGLYNNFLAFIYIVCGLFIIGRFFYCLV